MGSCLLAFGVPASAAEDQQQTANDSYSLEEVVVTAQKRRETLQDIPLAISAVNAESLERSGSRSFNDYIRSVPGVSFVDRGPTENKLVIRGVSDGPFASLGGYLRLDWQYVGNSISDFDDTSTLASIESYGQASYSLAGLRVGVQADRWEVALFLNNAFDEKAHTFVRDLAVPGVLTSMVNRPQTAGINLKARF